MADYTYQPVNKANEHFVQFYRLTNNAIAREEDAGAKHKKLDEEIVSKDLEIETLKERLANTRAELDVAQSELADRERLRNELDGVKRDLDDTIENLRQAKLRAKHFERQVQGAEQERDGAKRECQDIRFEYDDFKKELDKFGTNAGVQLSDCDHRLSTLR